MAAERGYREIMEDKERPPRESLNTEETENDGTYKLSESERNELKKERQMSKGTEICRLLANVWLSNWSASQR